MARVTKSPEVRRQEIIDAASRLFAERGYENTAVRDIVSEVGVAQGLFYYYFKNKDEVFIAAAQQQAGEFLENMARIIAQKGSSPLTRVRRAINSILAFLYSSDSYWRSMPETLSPQMYSRFNKMTGEMLVPYVAELIEEGRAEGVFHVKNPMYTAQFIIFGFVSLGIEQPPEAIVEIIDMVRTMIERILVLPVGSLSGEADS